jgi:hypothetical protein
MRDYSILPPAFLTRAASSGSSGLWSRDSNFTTHLLSGVLLIKIALESPELAQTRERLEIIATTQVVPLKVASILGLLSILSCTKQNESLKILFLFYS